MKKFLSVISLLLVAAMLMATPMYVSATETEVTAADKVIDFYTDTLGKDVLNVTTSVPLGAITADGIITAAERAYYTEYTINTPNVPNFYSNTIVDNKLDKITKASEPSDANKAISEKMATDMKFYFAQDDKNIYIAMYELGQHWDDEINPEDNTKTIDGENANNVMPDEDKTVGNSKYEFTARNNYGIAIGLDAENYGNFLFWTQSFSQAASTDLTLTYYENGVATSNTLKVKVGHQKRNYVAGDDTDFGASGTYTGNWNAQGGRYHGYTEIVLNKIDLQKTLGIYDTSTLLLGLAARSYPWYDNKSGGNVGGTRATSTYTGDYVYFGNYLDSTALAALNTATGKSYAYNFLPEIITFADVPSAAENYFLSDANGVTVHSVPAASAGAVAPTLNGEIGATEYAYASGADTHVAVPFAQSSWDNYINPGKVNLGVPTYASNVSEGVTWNNSEMYNYNTMLNSNCTAAKNSQYWDDMYNSVDFNYYFAEDEDYVYFAFKRTGGNVYRDDLTLSTGDKDIYMSLARDITRINLGFNPNDPDDFITLSDQYVAGTVVLKNNSTISTTSDDLTYNKKTTVVAPGRATDARASSIVPAGTVYTSTNASGSHVASSNASFGNLQAEREQVVEYRISKDFIKRATGSEFSGVVYFNVYINGQSNGKPDAGDETTSMWVSGGGPGAAMYAGSPVTSAAANITAQKFFPDVVVFSCSEHSYVHEVQNEDFLKTALTCTEDLVYYKSCICGAVDKSEAAATFTVTECVGHVSDNTLHFDADLEDANKASTTQHHELCTADVCVVEGKKINFADHEYNQEIVDAKYLATEKDCDSYETYYMSCICGAYVTTADTFENPVAGYRPHIPVLNTTDATEHWYDCQHEDCNAILDAEGNVAAKVRHTYDQTNDTTHPVGVRYCLTGSEFYKTCVCGRASTEDVDAETEGYVAAKFTQGEAPGHIWSEWVSNDPTHHWKICLSETCEDPYNGRLASPNDTIPGFYGAHNYVATDDLTKTEKAADATCTSPVLYYKVCECGKISATETFSPEGEVALGHDYAEAWTTDGTQHWHACSRGENCSDQTDAKNATASGLADHNYSEEVAEVTYLVSAATCEKKAVYYRSCVCGYFVANDDNTFEYGVEVEHDYDADELYFEPKAEGSFVAGTAQHYNICENADEVCDAEGNKVNFQNHVFDNEVVDDKYLKFAGDCKLAKVYYKSCDCGAYSDAEDAATFETEIVLTNHVWGDTPVSQNNYHFYQCVKCAATDDVVACTFANGSTKCAVCGGAAVTVAPVPSNPGTVVPEETTPVETQPAETQPAETQPAETQPAETQPAETQPAETTPAETQPAETEPAVTEPAETEPVATEPAETEPADEAGCAGAISIMGLALVATLGACGVVATKKKDEE